MTTFYVFSSEAAAAAAVDAIEQNIREWVVQNAPAALTPDGRGLRGRNAASGELEDVLTVSWDLPRQRLDGSFVIQKPTQGTLGPVPLEVAIRDLSATEETYTHSWHEPTDNNSIDPVSNVT